MSHATKQSMHFGKQGLSENPKLAAQLDDLKIWIHAKSPTPGWRAVYFSGPRPARDAEGNQLPVWVVYIGNKDARPIGRVYCCHSFEMGDCLSKRMAADRHLKLIREALTTS